MKKLIALILIAPYFLACNVQKKHEEKISEAEISLIDSLRNEIAVFSSFYKINAAVYNNIHSHDEFKARFLYDDRMPLKYGNTICYEDFVFTGHNSAPMITRPVYANHIADSLDGILFKLSEPLTVASFRVFFLASRDYRNYASLQFPTQYNYSQFEEYYSDFYSVKLSSKEEIRNKISDILYLENGNFDEALYDEWYNCVYREYIKMRSSYREEFDKLERMQELNIK